MSSSTAAHLILDEDELSLGNLSFGESDDGFCTGLGSAALDSSSSSLQSLKPISDAAAPQSPSLMILPPAKSTIGMMSTMSTAAAPPRMVSVESMSQVAAVPLKKPSKPTPLQSLKDLVSKKQQQQQQKEPTKSSNKRSLFESRIASIFDKPSLVLQKVVEQQYSLQTTAPAQEPALKKRKIDTTLHEACRRSSVTIAEVEDILAQDPTAAHRPATLMTHKRVYNPIQCKLDEKKLVPETYRYPLNLAIQYQANPDVLERLVAAAPQVLSTPDRQSTSLHILMRHKPQDQVTADMMLLKQPSIASWRDAKGNTALHQAVQMGACPQIIRHLTILEPKSLLQRNWHGQTPLDLAQRTSRVCSQDAADYLWNQTHEQF